MTGERLHKPLPVFSREQAQAAIDCDDIESLVYVALSIATYDLDWKYAQDLCSRLAEHPHKTVRGNAILALSHIARFQGRLEQHLAKPILLRARQDPESEVRERAEDAIERTNRFMRWRIGRKQPDKGVWPVACRSKG